MIHYAKLLTDSRYQAQTTFWQDCLACIEGDFHLRENWHSYALPTTGEIKQLYPLSIQAGQFVQELAAGQPEAAFVIILAAIYHALHLHTGAMVISVDTPLLHYTSEYQVKIPLITKWQTKQTVENYLDTVRTMIAHSYSYQDFPVSAVWEILLKHSNPLNTNLLVWSSALHQPLVDTQHYDLVIELGLTPTLSFTLYGKNNCFSPAYLDSLARHINNILIQYKTLQQPLDNVCAMDEAEEKLLLQTYNQTEQEFAFYKAVPELFYARAATLPHQIAISMTGKKFTYQELNEASNRLAHFLKTDLCIAPGEVVGLFFDRSELSIIALLAIFKVGGVYLPLDSEYPLERLQLMVEETNVKALLIHSDLFSQLTDFYAIPMFALDIQLSALNTPITDLAPFAAMDVAAYIIYTSGSTGKPKGVVVTHCSFTNMLLHHIAAFGIDYVDRVSQFYSANFDSSLFEIFIPLVAGATLVLIDRKIINDPIEFANYIEAQAVTMLTLPPVYLSTLDRKKLHSVNKIVSAGDNARLEDAIELARTKHYYNSYGPTEATVCITHYKVNADISYASRIPIGKPIANTTIYILDEQLRLLPLGCIGEICVGGIALAKEYLNRAELTATAFVEHPFIAGERLYRTGDLGLWLPDGNLELVGRKDTQVKIRGYRIELGEIESLLRQHAKIKEIVVLAREDKPGDKRLVAYLTLHSSITTAELRDYLRHKLPEFMLPTAFVFVTEMPITANGKIDHKALPSPQSIQDENSPIVAPQNDIEETLLKVWQEVLTMEHIGINDNFFELGGDSILIIQMVARANEYGLKLTPQEVFEHQTIATLATVAEKTSTINIEQGLITGATKLLPMQRWFFAQDLAEKYHYNQSVMLSVPANLSIELLQNCLQQLVLHHDVLRSRFFFQDEIWQQEILAEVPLYFTTTDLSVLSVGEREIVLEKEAMRLQTSLDLANGRLIAVELFQITATEARLLFVIHHLVVDGISWRILLEDFYTAYQQQLRGEIIKLPAKTTSVREWADCLQNYVHNLSTEYTYWLNEVRKDVARLPVEAHHQPDVMATVEEITINLTTAETHALLQEAPRAYNTQINDILLTALALTLREWTGKDQLLIDLEGHGREDISPGIDLSRTVAWLTAIYPVLLKVSEDDLATNLKAIKEQLRQIPQHGIGYGILRYLGSPEQRSKLAAEQTAEIAFNYLGQTGRALSMANDWHPVLGTNGGERSLTNKRSHLLEITGIVLDNQLVLTWSYSREINRTQTIKQWANRFIEILKSLITHCITVEARGYTPSDFPAARIDQKVLDSLVAKINQQ